MALKSPYCTISEANSYLSSSDVWSSLGNSEKSTHLTNGRYFIDSMYTCSGIDETTPQEEFKYANAQLALYDANTSIYTVSENGNLALTLKKVKAGSVESTKEYSRFVSSGGSKNIIDNYPMITSVLSEFCTLTGNGASSISTAHLVRS